MFKKLKQAVSAVLATTIAISAMPLTTIAETETPVTTGMSSKTTQYVLHASGSKSIQLNATSFNIGGSVYSGGNLEIYTANTRINGRAEMVGTLKKSNVHYNIYRTMPGAEARTYTDFSTAVYDSLGDGYTTHNWWQTYSGKRFANEASIYAKSGLQFATFETVLQGTIISEDSILVSSTTFNTAPDKDATLYTPKGNIGIYTRVCLKKKSCIKKQYIV